MQVKVLTILAAVPLTVMGCTGAEGPPGTAGEAGATGATGQTGDPGVGGGSCAVVDNNDGTFTMTCPDSAPVTFGSDTPPAEYASANLVRGAQLYDAYWEVTNIGITEPTSDNPMYPALGSKTASDTWRCKECHGWDYIGRDGRYGSGSHYTGVAGLYPATQSPLSAFLTIRDDHNYATAGLSDSDIWDLVKFYEEGMIDVDTALDDAGTFLGSASAGQQLFTNGVSGFDGSGAKTNPACSTCHGTDGTSGNPGAGAGFVEFPGFLANENPQETFHKIRFGTPGTLMAGTMVVHASTQDAIDIGAYAQTLSPTPWAATSVSRGAQLYDKYWDVTGVTAAAPTTTNPMYPDSAAKSLATTWRCKECHGWDYIGKDGRYSSGSHYTGIAGLMPALLTKWDAFEVIKNDHGYGAAGLADKDIWDLVAFYDAGMVDTKFAINTDGSFKGVAATGQALYDTNYACASCHNADGLNTSPPGVVGTHLEFPGLVSNDNPQEFLHKARFGAPGTSMTKTYDLGASLQQAADLSAYTQTLPCAPGPLFWNPTTGACAP